MSSLCFKLVLSSFLLVAGHLNLCLASESRASEPIRPDLDLYYASYSNFSYPSSPTRLADGTLLQVVRLADKDDIVLTVMRSRDGGAGFEPVGEMARASSEMYNIDGTFLFQLPTSSRVLAAYWNQSFEGAQYSGSRINLRASDDQGRSWTALSHPSWDTDLPARLPFLNSPSRDDTLQLYYSMINPDNSSSVYVRTSQDGGVSWPDSTIIPGRNLTDPGSLTTTRNTTSLPILGAVYPSQPQPLHLDAILGGLIGGLVLISAILVGLFWTTCRRHRQRRKDAEPRLMPV